MAVDEFAHTTAAEMEDFLGKSPAEQALRIWVNARETNGEVADIRRELSQQGLEIQKARLDLSIHVDGESTSKERAEIAAQVAIMWRWFDRLRFFILVVLALQPFEIAIIGWWLVHNT